MTTNSTFLNGDLLRTMERLFDSILPVADQKALPSYPPFDIIRHGENKFSLVLALAGFDKDDITINVENRVLSVAGKPSQTEGGDFLHRGIAKRAFEHKFKLGEHTEVNEAVQKNGLLEISLVRIIPEKLQSRKIEISTWKQAEAAE